LIENDVKNAWQDGGNIQPLFVYTLIMYRGLTRSRLSKQRRAVERVALRHLDPFAGIVHRLVSQGLENVSHWELPADSKEKSYIRENSDLNQLLKAVIWISCSKAPP
jgi:hypothetical protein